MIIAKNIQGKVSKVVKTAAEETKCTENKIENSAPTDARATGKD